MSVRLEGTIRPRWAAVCALLAASTLNGSPAPEDLDSVRQLLEQARYPEAEAGARALLEKAEAAHGPDSLEAARTLDLLVEALLGGGREGEPETRDVAERAVATKVAALGPDHPEVAESLTNQGTLLRKLADLDGARRVFERALTIREKALGLSHPEVAASLIDLANVQQTQSGYAEAQANYERALAIQEETLGSEHPDVARTLNGLAIMLTDLGDYDGARRRFERALAIREKALGPEHPLVTQILNNLARPLVNMGDLAAARELRERVLRQWTKRLGPGDPAVAAASLNLGDLYAQMGDYNAARPLYESALSIWERAHGPEHPRVALALRSLGLLLIEAGDYSGAQPLLLRALAIREKSRGPEDLLVGESLKDLGRLARLTGDHAAAGPLLDRALAIQRKVLGQAHPEVAGTLREIATLRLERGDYDAARSLCEQSLQIEEASLGAEHPALAATLAGLARALFVTAHPAEALGAGLRAEEIGREHLRLTARSLTERQALRFSAVRGSGLDAALSVVAKGMAPDSVGEIWDALIRSRALVLDEMASRHRRAVESDDPAVPGLVQELALAASRLANLTLRGPDDQDPVRFRRILEEARAHKEQAEQALAEKSLAFRREQGRSRTGYAEVRAALPRGGVLVAYALYRQLQMPGRASTGGNTSGSIPSYLALALRADEAGPAVVPLGPAARIDELIRRWRQETGSRPGPDRTATANDEARYFGDARALRRAVWDPLAPHLREARIVFVVPDGPLHVVNFAALPGDREAYLIESGPTVHYLSAERDLVPPGTGEVEGQGLLALGGPAYDVSLSAALSPEGEATVRSAAVSHPGGRVAAPRPFRGARPVCHDFEAVRFAPLPASVREVREVARIWARAGRPMELLTGAGASEGVFKTKASGRQILHLATHGFFLGGLCPSALDGSRGIGGLAEAEGRAQAPIAGENPLLLSGLALAGANRRSAARPDEDDGILTAEEVATMDLSGVEWAVLSACDTGAGEVKAGEGVLGLRRGFQVAGARTVIISLWPVEDEAARRWMTALYQGRLLARLGTAEAVREAGLKVLRERRAKAQSIHPFFWGAFVAAGDWR